MKILGGGYKWNSTDNYYTLPTIKTIDGIRAAYFCGGGIYATTPSAPDIGPGTDWDIQFWIRPDKNNPIRGDNYMSPVLTSKWFYGYNVDNPMAICLSGLNTIYISNYVSRNPRNDVVNYNLLETKWYFIELSYSVNDNHCYFFINGKLLSISNLTNDTCLNNIYNLGIGCDAVNGVYGSTGRSRMNAFYHGYMKDYKIYDNVGHTKDYDYNDFFAQRNLLVEDSFNNYYGILTK